MIIFYTDKFVPTNSAGCARGPIIFIKPKYKDDVGLLEHEKVHVRQWLRTCTLHTYLYLLSKKYRLKSEVEAYKAQLKYAPKSTDLFATYLSRDYNLSITKEEAKKLLIS